MHSQQTSCNLFSNALSKNIIQWSPSGCAIVQNGPKKIFCKVNSFFSWCHRKDLLALPMVQLRLHLYRSTQLISINMYG